MSHLLHFCMDHNFKISLIVKSYDFYWDFFILTRFDILFGV